MRVRLGNGQEMSMNLKKIHCRIIVEQTTNVGQYEKANCVCFYPVSEFVAALLKYLQMQRLLVFLTDRGFCISHIQRRHTIFKTQWNS
jgi:hypothetical protein